MHRLLCVTGLPRAGSTLLCQLLGLHSQIYSPGYSSPLCAALVSLRAQLSDNPFLLAQLDNDPQGTHDRLLRAFRGFVGGWLAETDRPWVADKNRGWLHHLELAALLVPDVRMLVCVREPGQIFGSIEKQHRKTLLLDFPDDLAQLTPYDRADRLFASNGVVGEPLRSLRAAGDRDVPMQAKLYYVVFEHLVSEPQEAMADIYRWLDLPPEDFNPGALPVSPHESDSHYRMKYPHATRDRILSPERHWVPSSIEADLRKNFRWFYETFYPGLLG